MNYKRMFKHIPSKIRVATKTFFAILWSDDLVDKNGNVLHGITEFDNATDSITRQIILNKNQTPRETLYTLVHEYYHSINFEHKIGLTESQILKLEDCYPYTRELILTLEYGDKSK